MTTVETRVRTPRPWLMLGLGVAAQTATTVFVTVPAFLIPLLHSEYGYSLAAAGLLAAAPNVGLVLTLIAWGAITDRFGERAVISIGVALTAAAGAFAMLSSDVVWLGAFFLIGGMASASVNAASGRVVIGWFPKERRGLVMGIRQMCQPLGVTIASLTVPPLAAGVSITAAIAVPVLLLGVLAVACAIGVVDPPRTPRAELAEPPANPYRAHNALWRIHLVSALLVVPQFTLSTFGLVWLVADQGWDPLPAGVLIGAAQFAGAFGRLGVGVLSDRVGSNLRPLRWVALAGVVVLLCLAGASAAHAGMFLAAALFVIATTVSVADNGLAFTSVAVIAGPYWSGRALGAQNTGQFAAAAVVGPAVGALTGVVGYPLAFVAVALVPAIALPLVPSARQEAELSD